MTAALRLVAATGPTGTISPKATAPRRLRALPTPAPVASVAAPKQPDPSPSPSSKRTPKQQHLPAAITQAGETTLGSALDMWCAEISHLPLLSVDEEHALALHMLNGGAGGEAAREQLFHANVRWATELAGRYAHRTPGHRGRGSELMADLVQVASLTLWQVLPDYDWRRGRVTTFVTRAIIRDLRRWLDDNGALIRRPVWLADYERKLHRALDALDAAADAEHGSIVHSALSSPPTAAARAAMATELALLQAQHQPIVSLSGTTPGGDAYDLSETLIAHPESKAHESLAHAEAIAQQSAGVAAFVARIIPRERDRQILALYYGDRAPYAGNMAEIAKVFGITRSRVQQIHAKALKLLRAADKTSGELRALATMSAEGGEG